MKNWKSDFEDV